jgi:hypothetical protein
MYFERNPPHVQAELERRKTELALKLKAARRETEVVVRDKEIARRETELEAARQETEAIRLKVIEAKRGMPIPMPVMVVFK